jgi:hypothetical protein
VESRVSSKSDFELYKNTLRTYVLELIDRKLLRSSQYRNIYHSDLLYDAQQSMAQSLVSQEPSIQAMNNTVLRNTRGIGSTT